MTQALDRAVANGVKNLVVQPTHLMHGAEYDEMCATIDEYRDQYESVSIAAPQLAEVGSDATYFTADNEVVAIAIAAAVREALRAKEEGASKTILFNLSGHGMIDLYAYEQYFADKLQDYTVTDAELRRTIDQLDRIIK